MVVTRPKSKQHFCAERGYDSPDVHQVVTEERYIAHIKHRRRRGEPALEVCSAPGEKTYPARRWVVERTLGWLCKRRRTGWPSSTSPQLTSCSTWLYSDRYLSDKEWQALRPLFRELPRRGRKRKWSIRHVLNMYLRLVVSGAIYPPTFRPEKQFFITFASGNDEADDSKSMKRCGKRRAKKRVATLTPRLRYWTAKVSKPLPKEHAFAASTVTRKSKDASGRCWLTLWGSSYRFTQRLPIQATVGVRKRA